MNILFLGPQGSGKGTQARLLAEKKDFYYFDAGGFLREIADKKPFVKEILDKGKLVPEEEFSSYIFAFFDEKGQWDNIIFDGFPRTIEEYEFLKTWLNENSVKLDVAFVLNISEETTIERLSTRRMDPVTGQIYNLITNKPPKEIEGRLLLREDDKPEAIKRRLATYNEMTIPLINELKKDVKVIEIDGEKEITQIQSEIERALE